MSAVIEVENLSVSGKLEGISLTVAAGEVVAVVGSRGAGKSTLARILAGQMAPGSGSAAIAGVDCREPAARLLAGVAGEAWGLYERLTAVENLRMFARLMGASEARIPELLRRLELTGLENRRVEKLLSGEVARLKLARALLQDPPALVLDEPMGDIDRESATIIAFCIGEEADRGKAVLMTTFGYRTSVECATRVCYLEGGRLIDPEPEQPNAVGSAASETAGGPPAPPAQPERAHLPHVAARKGERLLLFRPEEIRYAYAQEKAVYIQTAEGACAVTLTLSDLEERLQGEGFFRCHRAYLVNVNWVKELVTWTRDSYSLVLKDGKDVPLSKHRAPELKARLSL